MKIQTAQKKPGFVYLIEAVGLNRFKIGITRSMDTRLKYLRTSSPLELRLVHSWRVFYPEMIEQSLHTFFSEKRILGEWFALSDSDVAWIRDNHRTSTEMGL